MYATFLFLPHFDIICDLLLNRRTATWNVLVKHKIYGYDFHEQFLTFWFPFHPLLIYILQLEVTL